MRTPLARWLLPSYSYQFSPSHLGMTVDLLDRTAAVDGAVLEVGCYQGATTVFLNEHLRARASAKRYFAVDTFSGFTDDDVAAERVRGRTSHPYGSFRRNRIETYRKTMNLNGIDRVTAIQADAKTFDYSSIGPFSFCLIDVDLYEPVRAALVAIYPRMAPGGVIVVDDCDAENPVWRGAFEAYTDFVTAEGLANDIREHMLGVVWR